MASPEGPVEMHCQAGKKYAFCRCGRSSTLPRCDGSHRADPDGPQPLKFIAARDEVQIWCACGRTGRAPQCDKGHHCPAGS